MYQIHADVLNKVTTYVKIARQFREDIKEINVTNEIEEYFGKKYCRVYVRFNLKEGSTKQSELQQVIWNIFMYDKEYFSFYLIADRRDDENTLRNIEELCHYEYIWNLLEWLLQKDEINVNAISFTSQYDLKLKEDERTKKYDAEKQLIENAVNHLEPVEGQFIAIKQWSQSSLRLGTVENVTLPGKRQSFDLKLTELKKDLKPGKNSISLWSKSNIFAIIQPEQLPGGLSKTLLITMLEQGDNFTGLLWRRPQELW